MDVDPNHVGVVLAHMQGEVRRVELAPTYMRLSVGAPGGDFSPIKTPQGDVPLCLVEVFKALRGHAKRAQNDYLGRPMLRRV